MESLGTADFDFYDGLLTQLVNVGTQGKTPDERGTNFMLAMVKGIGPKDEIEAMMAAQMAAVHMTTMTFARRLAHAGEARPFSAEGQERHLPIHGRRPKPV